MLGRPHIGLLCNAADVRTEGERNPFAVNVTTATAATIAIAAHLHFYSSLMSGRVRNADTCRRRRLCLTLQKQKRSSPNAIRGAIVRGLVPSLQELLCELGGDRPEVLFAQGHRWGAAFPASSFDSGGSSATDQFYLDRTNAFAACGDFFTPFPGRVEGGWISGTSLADAIR